MGRYYRPFAKMVDVLEFVVDITTYIREAAHFTFRFTKSHKNMTTRWPPRGGTRISWKFGHQVARLVNLNVHHPNHYL